jgi:hypothetical protein
MSPEPYRNELTDPDAQTRAAQTRRPVRGPERRVI